MLLQDEVYPVEVTLFFKTYAREDVVEQWSVIKNREKGAIDLIKYASANLYFAFDNYYLTSYHGSWAREMKPEETLLTNGIKTLDSKPETRFVKHWCYLPYNRLGFPVGSSLWH